MARATWAAEAEADLAGVYTWIAHRVGRRAIARTIVRELREKCDRYAEIFTAGSTIGTPRPDLGESCRVFSHKRWIVIFRPAAHGIEVVRVLDGSQDLSQPAD